MKNRLFAREINERVGDVVEMAGWVHARRDHGKVLFFDLRDKTGLTQVVVTPEQTDAYQVAETLSPEDVVICIGSVAARPERLQNPNIASGKVELQLQELQVEAKAASLPVTINDPELVVSLPTLLDYRPLTLRHLKTRDIFRLKSQLIASFRAELTEAGFQEIFVPTLVPTATEGGAEVFHVDYYEHDAYLAQSPQLYKQMMVGVFERVFTIAHAYRAEPSVTTRHLAEYVSLDVEMGFIDDYRDLMQTVERVMRRIFRDVEQHCPDILTEFNTTVPKLSERIPVVKLREALEIIYQETGRDNRTEPDLSPQDERDLCAWAEKEHGSELVFVTHYPTKKRPMYTYPDPENPEETLSFDLLGRGLEWVTGGQRINNYDQLMSNIKKWGNDPAKFEMYLQAFRYGMPKEGGFAIGAERVVAYLLGLENIRQASLFPRDMERVDVRLSQIETKK